jgi:predicted dehydrogenase
MSNQRRVNIGMIGAGWWPNTMHMPALATCAQANVVAVCDDVPALSAALAEKYAVPNQFTNYQELLASGLCEAVIVATPNDTHHPIVMAALERGLHVMCEKPLALSYAQAAEMAARAKEKRLITTVPFTYRHMPSTRYLKHLISEQGYLGQPYHMHMRYYAGFAREPGQYLWRFDRARGGSGALADIGSHFLHLAEWFFGDIDAVCAQLSTMIKRAPTTPQGQPYQQADDSAMVMLRFKNGAQGLVHASVIAYEKTYANEYGFDQVHEFDFHGSDGTLRQVIDWDFRQQITGDRPGDGPERVLEVPDAYWGNKRRERAIDTWEDVFRQEGRMIHEFVHAVASGQAMIPDFDDGARVQQLLDAAIASAEAGCWVSTARGAR